MRWRGGGKRQNDVAEYAALIDAWHRAGVLTHERAIAAAPPGRDHHFPFQRGGRFSVNAFTPSIMSSDLKSSAISE